MDLKRFFPLPAVASVSLVLLCAIGQALSQGESACQFVGWSQTDQKCPPGTTEMFREHNRWSGSTLRACCNKKHPNYESKHIWKGEECRITPCVPNYVRTSNVCSQLNERTAKGRVIDNYEEILQEPCTYQKEPGRMAQCCLRNSTEGALATVYGAEPNEFPHMAKLKPADCGATIYNKKWILTAAHCVVDKVTKEQKEVNGMYVVLGSNIGSNSENQYKYDITRVVVHPKYTWLKGSPELKNKYPKIFNDLALLEVAGDGIKFGPKVKALKIAPKGFRPLDYADNAVIVGWGTTDTLELSMHLQKANFIIRSDEACFDYRKNQDVPYGNNLEQKDQLLCVGGILEGKWSPLAGEGDSGGPAICRSEDGTPVLCGVTSFSGTTDEQCLHGQTEETCKPSVYAEVSYSEFQDWILKTAGKQDRSTFYQPYLYGKKVPQGKYSHQVYITSSDGGKPCGGTLVSPTVVLTAAHCALTDRGELRKGVKITSGINDVNEAGKTHKVTKFSVADGFKRMGDTVTLAEQGNRIRIVDQYYKSNLVLLKLDSKSNVPSNQIPPISEDFAPQSGVEFAFPRNASRSGQLLSRDYKLLSMDECQSRMNRMTHTGMNVKVDATLLCGVEKYSGGSTCDRTLGGGMMCKGRDGTEALCGVQFFRLCEWSIPNGFINLALYKNWISRFVQSNKA